MDTEALVADATARIVAAADSAALEAVRIEVLGRKAPLVLALRELGSLPPDERPLTGPAGRVPPFSCSDRAALLQEQAHPGQVSAHLATASPSHRGLRSRNLAARRIRPSGPTPQLVNNP